MAKTIVLKTETPEDHVHAALKGKKQAQGKVLTGPYSRIRFLVLEGGKIDRDTSAAAFVAFTQGRGEQRVGVAKTPAEHWGGAEHCVVDGSALVNGRNLDLELDYSSANRDLLVRLRVLVAAGLLGESKDTQADAVEAILEHGLPTSTRQARRNNRRLDPAMNPTLAAEMAAAERWLLGTGTGPPSARPPHRAVVSNVGVDFPLAAKAPGSAHATTIIARNVAGVQVVGKPAAESGALKMWREKLEFLLAEQVKAAGPTQKFALQEDIKEARAAIQELGG